ASLALRFGALVLFVRSCDRSDLLGVLLAGLVAGVAMQTKYTAFLAPVTMALYAAVQGLFVPCLQWRPALTKLALGLAAVGEATGLFIAWEAWIAGRYGDSHFLLEYRSSQRALWTQLEWFAPLLPTLLGGVASAVVLLGLAALCRRPWVVIVVGVLIAGGFGLVAGAGSMEVTAQRGLIPAAWAVVPLSLEEVVFFGLGLLGI